MFPLAEMKECISYEKVETFEKVFADLSAVGLCDNLETERTRTQSVHSRICPSITKTYKCKNIENTETEQKHRLYHLLVGSAFTAKRQTATSFVTKLRHKKTRVFSG